MKTFDSQILKTISEKLYSSEETVGIAESVSSGLLQLAFSQMENSMLFFEGGITAYNIDQKVKQLKIDRIHGDEVNCVSEEIACQMALGAISLFNSDWGLAITGYATPVPQSGEKCFAFYAIAYKGLIKKSNKIKPVYKNMPAIQLEYTHYLLNEFDSLLEKNAQN